MEAMLCNTPVINDLPENLFGEGRLKNGENIVLVNSHDPHSIAAGITRLLRDENLRQRIGAQGRRFVLDHLSWDNIAAAMEEFYKRVLSERGAITNSVEHVPA
jgi:glycosyltransferase involved in cell wall biosynthesis